MSTFTFSEASRRRLEGVKPDLLNLCDRALQLSPIDFGILQGMRTLEDQAVLVSVGASQTMDSKHLTGEAIDFAPYWGGRYREEFPFFYLVADAFKDASLELAIRFRWGGAWTEDMWSSVTAQAAQEAYIMKRAAIGSVFFDAAHIELVAEATLAA